MTRMLQTCLILVVTAGICGCATMVPERKIPVEKPRIQEEDVTEGQPGSYGAGEEQPPPMPGVAPSPPIETPSQPIEPGSRPPRRIPFRDRRSDRADGSTGKEGTIGLAECLCMILGSSLADGPREKIDPATVAALLVHQRTSDT